MTESLPAPPRKRGAQPNNRNNYRHGFYARRLNLDSSTPLPPENSLDNEIAMLRLSIRNILEQSTQPVSGQMEMDLMRTISLAAAAINKLIKTQHYLGSLANPLRDALHAALREIRDTTPGTILDDSKHLDDDEWDSN